MQTNPLPEIEASDVKAVRDFLTSVRDEQRKGRETIVPLATHGTIPVRNGIARARHRSAAKTSA